MISADGPVGAPRRSFEEIGRSAGTDKITHHGYQRFYPLFLEQLRDKQIVMLEIGTDRNASLVLWKEYFPFSKIYGIDNGNGFVFDRGEVFKGDQSDVGFLKGVIEKIGQRLDFVIDDGSHKPEHQLETFCFLFDRLLKKGGIYIIEDIETNYWKGAVLYGNLIQKGYKHKSSVIEIFKVMIDKMNEEYVKDKSDFESSPIPINVQNEIGMISFQHNSIIIVKKDDSYEQFEKRQYRNIEAL